MRVSVDAKLKGNNQSEYFVLVVFFGYDLTRIRSMMSLHGVLCATGCQRSDTSASGTTGDTIPNHVYSA